MLGDAVLSGGGARGPLISLRNEGHSLSHYWPEVFPNTYDPACNGHTKLARLGYLMTNPLDL